MKTSFKLQLEEKIAVITGGAGSICSTFAEALAAQGAKVIILDIDEKDGEKIAESISKNGFICRYIKTDVVDLDSLNNAKEEVKQHFGTPDILINGAGGNNPVCTTTNDCLKEEDLVKDDIKTFFDLELEGIKYVFDLNFLGTFLTTQVFAEEMILKDKAVIINISSMNALTPLTRIPAYSAAKSAVSNFTKWLAVHFSEVGIRVNAIAPGFFLSKQTKNLFLNKDGSYTKRANKIISHTPLKRLGNEEELVGTLLWLVDENLSGFVNGVVVPVDGGFSSYSGV